MKEISDSRARLATHPISTLNKLILGIKKDLPLALSLKKKRYSKEQLIEHLIMLGQAKLIDLSKIPALKKKAASKSAAAVGVKSGDKLPYKKKAKPATHSMPDGTKMTGKTHTASSKPVREETAGERKARLEYESTEKKRKALEKSSQPKKSKPKKSKKSLDEMTLHKKQLKDDIREMKKFLKKKVPVDPRIAISNFEGALEKHQREVDEELEERGGRKLGYSEVFSATKELVKEHGDLFNEVEKKIMIITNKFKEAEAKKPLSKKMKAMIEGGAEAVDKLDAKKKAKKASKPPSAAQLAARKKFGDAAKERSAAAKKRQDVIDNTTVSYGVYKYKKKPKKV